MRMIPVWLTMSRRNAGAAPVLVTLLVLTQPLSQWTLIGAAGI